MQDDEAVRKIQLDDDKRNEGFVELDGLWQLEDNDDDLFNRCYNHLAAIEPVSISTSSDFEHRILLENLRERLGIR